MTLCAANRRWRPGKSFLPLCHYYIDSNLTSDFGFWLNISIHFQTYANKGYLNCFFIIKNTFILKFKKILTILLHPISHFNYNNVFRFILVHNYFTSWVHYMCIALYKVFFFYYWWFFKRIWEIHSKLP